MIQAPSDPLQDGVHRVRSGAPLRVRVLVPMARPTTVFVAVPRYVVTHSLIICCGDCRATCQLQTRRRPVHVYALVWVTRWDLDEHIHASLLVQPGWERKLAQNEKTLRFIFRVLDRLSIEMGIVVWKKHPHD